jgi:hypothetical protein
MISTISHLGHRVHMTQPADKRSQDGDAFIINPTFYGYLFMVDADTWLGHSLEFLSKWFHAVELVMTDSVRSMIHLKRYLRLSVCAYETQLANVKETIVNGMILHFPPHLGVQVALWFGYICSAHYRWHNQ